MLGILAKAKPTPKGRLVGCLVADGTNLKVVTAFEVVWIEMDAELKGIAPKAETARGATLA